MESHESQPIRERPYYFSKTDIKEKWSRLDLDLESPPPSEEQTVLSEIYDDDLFGLGNE